MIDCLIIAFMEMNLENRIIPYYYFDMNSLLLGIFI